MTASVSAADAEILARLANNAWRLTPDALAHRWGVGFERPKHVRLLGRIIAQAVARGDGRLLVSLPPRHAKSETCSHWTPTWALHLDPSLKVLLAMYQDGPAEEWGRAVRNTCEEHPELGIEVALDSSAASRWRTKAGGGMWTAGIGGVMTGRGGELLIIDDPYKNWADAMSATYRTNVMDWWRAVARTRLHPNATVIVVQTRWHEEDLIGQLLDAGGWTHIRLPALAEPEEDGGEVDVLGRTEGEALWPERYDLAALNELRQDLGEFVWTGLYQQRPRALVGDLFDRTRWQRADAPPAHVPLVRRFDLAATAGGDYSAAVLLGMDAAGLVWVVDVRRMRGTPAEVEHWVTAIAEDDVARYGPKVWNRIEQEPGSSGIAVRDRYMSEVLAGRRVEFKTSTGDKFVRALPFAAQQGAGRVILCRRPTADGRFETPLWWDDYVEEHSEFPRAAHDDQVDASSLAYSDLLELKRTKRPSSVRSAAGVSLPGDNNRVGALR